MDLAELKRRINDHLDAGAKSIPALSKILKVDEYSILVAIDDLEESDEIILDGFDQLYREDGGAIYLAKYAKKVRA